MPIEYLEEADAIKLLREGTGVVAHWNAYRSTTKWPIPRLSFANLDGLVLPGINLSRAYLLHAGFARADLSGATFENAFLRGADLRGAELDGAVFDGADLTHADLRYAQLAGASFLRAKLSGAMLGDRINRATVRRAGASFDSESSGHALAHVDIAVFDSDVSMTTAQAIENALTEWMDACGFAVESIPEAVYGSWFQKLKFWSKQHVTAYDAEQLLEEGKQALLANLERASLDGTAVIAEAARGLIDSIASANSARIHVGQLLILKTTVDGESQILVETVSSQLARKVRQDAALYEDPKQLIKWIDEHRADYELGEPTKE